MDCVHPGMKWALSNFVCVDLIGAAVGRCGIYFAARRVRARVAAAWVSAAAPNSVEAAR